MRKADRSQVSMPGGFVLGFSLFLLALASVQCVPIPTVGEKVIELALGSTMSMPLDAEGAFNLHPIDAVVTVDLTDSLDIREVLDDANINYDDLKDITLAGAAYQVLEKDPTPDRRIVNGSVAVRREGVVSPSTLIDPLNIDVNSLVGYENALLSASGVAVINDILSDIVAEIRTGQQAQNTTVTFIITGRSEPVGTPTDFKWELKLYFSILGALKIDMVEF